MSLPLSYTVKAAAYRPRHAVWLLFFLFSPTIDLDSVCALHTVRSVARTIFPLSSLSFLVARPFFLGFYRKTLVLGIQNLSSPGKRQNATYTDVYLSKCNVSRRFTSSLIDPGTNHRVTVKVEGTMLRVVVSNGFASIYKMSHRMLEVRRALIC